MPPLAIIGGIAAIGGTVGKAIAGNAAANAQQKLAGEQINSQNDYRNSVLAASKPTPDMIADLDKQANVAEQGVARQQKLLDAVDPALIEAGNQALQLLKGQEAATLNPIKLQRARQRTALENSLRQQLGSGYSTSSAGIEALTRFDQQTSEAVGNAQDQALGRLLNTAQQSRPDINQMASLAGTRLRGEQQFQQTKLQGIEAAGRNISQNEAQLAGDVAARKNEADLFGGLGSLGGSALGAALPGMSGGGSSPAASGGPTFGGMSPAEGAPGSPTFATSRGGPRLFGAPV